MSLLPVRAIALACLSWGLACASPALASTFTAISQDRSVAMSGQLSIVDLDTGDSLSVSLAAPRRLQAPPGSFGLFDASVGLGDLVLDNPLGNASGAGRAAQTSSLTPQAIVFDGIADVFMSGFASGNAQVQGSGSASSRLTYSFSIAESMPAVLNMSSEIGPRSNNFSFSLLRSNGDVVWDQTSIFDDNGVESRSFSQRLDLAPDTYSLSTTLSASSFFDNNSGSSGRVLANFSISPVPEPGAAWMLLTGLAALPWVMRHRRRRGAARRARLAA